MATMALRWGDTLADLMNVPVEVLENVEREAQRREMPRAFGELSRLQQQILRMDYAGDPREKNSVDDRKIADLLDTTVKTVRVERSRAKKRLREHYAAQGYKGITNDRLDELLSDFVRESLQEEPGRQPRRELQSASRVSQGRSGETDD